MKNKTFFHIIYMIFLWNFLCLFFFLGSLKCFFFHSIILSDLQRATKTLRWLLLGLFSLHTYTVGSALIFFIILPSRRNIQLRKGEEVNGAGRKVSREHQTGQTSTSSTTATAARAHARTLTRPHIYCTVYPGFTVGATVIWKMRQILIFQPLKKTFQLKI